MASSVWGDVGFAAIEVEDRVVFVVGEGAWRRRNLTSEREVSDEGIGRKRWEDILPPVMKQDT